MVIQKFGWQNTKTTRRNKSNEGRSTCCPNNKTIMGDWHRRKIGRTWGSLQAHYVLLCLVCLSCAMFSPASCITCPRVLHASFLTCSCALLVSRPHVLRTLCAVVPHVSYVLLYLTYHVPCVFWYCLCLVPNVHLCLLP